MEVELWQAAFMVQAVSSFKDIHLPSSFTVCSHVLNLSIASSCSDVPGKEHDGQCQ